MNPRSRQGGLAGATVIILLILGLLALILGARIFDSQVGLDQREVTEANLRRVSEALVNYASLNQRLPCPADGNGSDGTEVATPAGPPTPGSPVAYTTCTFPDGVVPWASLALRESHALDGWGRRISYRVFAGTSGVTQSRYVAAAVPPRIVGGVNIVDCNAALGAPIAATLGSGNYCQPATGPAPGGSPPPNTPDQHRAARSPMIVVQDQGTARNDLAFVLISHGETGYGAFSAQGGAGRTVSPAGAGKEIVNVGAAGEYWLLARSPPATDAADANHYDDIVAYMSFAELTARANLKARAYSEYPLSATFTQAAVEAATGSSNIDSTQNTGRTSLALGGFLIRGSSSGGVSRNVGFREQGDGEGIGVIGGSSTSGDLNSTFGEMLTFQLGEGSQYAKVDIAFNVFEIRDFSPLEEERAEIAFWKAGLPLQAIAIDAWDEHPEPSRCLFRLPASLVFDRFDVTALPQSGGGGSSRFTISAVRACDATTTPCQTTTSPTTAFCPIDPAGAATSDPTGIGTTGATLRARVEDNGIAAGTGSGYSTNGDSYSFSERVITITGGTGTILDGNCVQFAGDSTVYPVTRGLAGPGDLVIASPGLRLSIPSSPRSVSVVPCTTSVRFDWGATCSAGYPASVNASPATINAGAGSTNVSVALTGLACGTSYHYRVRATNLIATTTSPNAQFRTSACGFSTATALTTTAIVSTSTVTLSGTVNGNGEAVTPSFEYGETSCYGSTATAAPASVAAGAGATGIAAILPVVPPPAGAGQLRCGTTYHYRAVAAAGSGTRHGENATFKTPDC